MNYPIRVLEKELEKLKFKIFMLAPTIENKNLILEIENKCIEIEQAILLILGE